MNNLTNSYLFFSYDEATKTNTTDMIGYHGCKAEMDHIPNPQTHRCVEHQNECFNVDLSTLFWPYIPPNIELCFCTEDRYREARYMSSMM